MVNIKITNEFIEILKRQIFETRVNIKFADETQKEALETKLDYLKQLLRIEMTLQATLDIKSDKIKPTPTATKKVSSSRQELINIMTKGKEDIYDQYKRR